jgi:uncharacterized protein DUF6709
MDTWILRMVKVRSARRAAAWAIAVAFVGLFLFGQVRYIKNFVAGPHEAGAAELGSIADASTAPQYFVRVTGSKLIETGIQQITVEKTNGVETSRHVSAAFYALAVGDRLLVVKSTSGSHETFEGALTPMPAELEQHLFDTREMKAIRGRFYPYYLDDESFRQPGYWGIAGMLVFALLVWFFARPALRYWQDPASHPLVARALAWGDPLGVAVAAEREARSPRFKGKNGWLVTDQFLILSSFFTFDLLRLGDLIWAHKKVTKHSVNFIPTGKTYDALLYCYGGTATISGAEDTVDQVLGFAAQRAPWAVFGFTEELATLFKKDQRRFCAAVEQRRRGTANERASAPAPIRARTASKVA